MARWVFIRHGETSWNAEFRVQGQTDVPLSDKGRREARDTGLRLAGLQFVAAYASDLARTEQTARIILGVQRNNPIPLTTESSLREISFGVLEGMNWDEIRRADPRTENRENVRQLDFAPEGGESFRQLLKRTGVFAEELLSHHQTDDILIVAHGGSLRALIVRILGMPDSFIWKLRGLRPASISIVTYEHGVAALSAWNDNGHLREGAA